jgi:UDP-N-acetylmuramyl pentapeptide synthase
MPKTVAKILDILSTRIVEKYKPVIIGVFDDGDDGAAALMIKEVLANRYDVRLSGKISEPDTEVPLAIIGTDQKISAVNVNILAKGIGLALKKGSPYPNVVILRIEARRTSDMKKMLESVHPDIAVFAPREEDADAEVQEKRSKRKAREKALLFRCLKKNDYAIFSADDAALKEVAGKSRCSKMTFGFSEESKVKGKIFRGGEGEEAMNGNNGTSFKITYKGTIVPFYFPSEVGERQVYAALAAAAVGLHLGSNLVEISEVLRK